MDDPASLAALLTQEGQDVLALATRVGALAGASPDGSSITAPTPQTLVTADGTWSFGTAVPPWGSYILLNGVQTSGAAATLKVANGGKLYALTGQGDWYVYQGGTFVASGAP